MCGLTQDFIIVVTQDGIVHVKSAKDLVTRNEVPLQLSQVTAGYFRDPLTMVVGDITGKIEVMYLSRENLDSLTSKHYEFHRAPVQFLHTEEKEKDDEAGFWIVSCASNVFALWDSELNIKPIMSLYLDLEPGDQIVCFGVTQRGVEIDQKRYRLSIKISRRCELYTSSADFWLPD